MAKIFPCSSEKLTESAAITSSESDEKKFFFLNFFVRSSILSTSFILVLYSPMIRNLCKAKIAKI